MISPDTFEMIEFLTRDALARHPVWSQFDEQSDRDAVVRWGVRGDAVDRAFARFEFCGQQPLYPVLELNPLPRKPHLIVAVRFDAPCGLQLDGYVLEPHAFGVFVGEREFCFNRNLPTLAAQAAGQLGAALGMDPAQLFPLRYASGLRRHDGQPIEGEVSAPPATARRL